MSRKLIIVLLTIGIIAVAIGGYYYYNEVYVVAQEPEEPPIQTATVRQGELVVSATGAGTVIPVTETNLGFRSGGILSELLVQVGDQVKAGDILARVDDTESQLQVEQAGINLRTAELQLEKLLEDPGTADLASAQSSLVSALADQESLLTPATNEELAAAQQNLLSAQQTLNDLLSGPADDDMAGARAELALAEIAVQQAQSDYDKVAWRSDIGQLQQSVALQEATIAFDKAKSNYDAQAAGASADQISSSRAQVSQAQATLDALQEGPTGQQLAAAQAKVDLAQAQLDSLMEGTGVLDIELAQLSVDQAQKNLDSADNTLADTELIAPFEGVVTSLDSQVGENVGSSAFIHLADLGQPLLEIFLDETDLDKVATGFEVDVVFDAFPDDTFVGTVVQVDPSLATESGTTVVRALVRLDEASFAKPLVLPIGLNATVEVIGGRANNAMLVPVEALREITPGQFAVFVMENGEPKLQMVEVGLMDFTFAEIVSGLERGDVVSTGIIRTQ
ncbi:MAG: efflux RND transporter periplasmic adaptor subunit [Chloroflexota bacterium]|nr:efflux RND transporter periplasmic adaptor subunit [Chloroflexota bacterium]